MPKPTTHTDIIVISTQNPPPNPDKETVEIDLTSGVTPNATAIEAVPTIVVTRSGGSMPALHSGPVIIEQEHRGDTLLLAFSVRITFGGGADNGDLTTTPAPFGTVDDSTTVLGTYEWENTASDALIANLLLTVEGHHDVGTLTLSATHSTQNGDKLLTVEYKMGSKVVGELKLTASMNANVVQ